MVSFHKDIWKKKSTRDIILSLTTLIKKSTNSVKKSSMQLYMNFAKRLNLIHYKIIESITKNSNNYDTYEAVCSNNMDLQNGACDQSLGLGSSLIIKRLTSIFSESKTLRRITNHPVHAQDNSPTALIPFCDFDGNMSAVDVKIEDSETPFCTGFEEKIVKDKICYSINLNDRTQKGQIEEENDLSFTLYISYNEDRQLDSIIDLNMTSEEEDFISDKYVLVETISKLKQVLNNHESIMSQS